MQGSEGGINNSLKTNKRQLLAEFIMARAFFNFIYMIC